MTSNLILAAIAAVTLGTAATAQTADRTSAAPTARSGPDGGKSYEYPPSTGAILPPSQHTPYEKDGERPPASRPGTAGLSPAAPGQVGR